MKNNLFIAILVLVSFSSLVSAKEADSCNQVPKFKSAKAFLEHANQTLYEEKKIPYLSDWVRSVYISDDTTRISADLSAKYKALFTQYALESKKYKGKTDDEKRQLEILLRSLVLPSPRDAGKNKELSTITAELESEYGSAKYCKSPNECKDFSALEDIMTRSRNPNELLDAWEGWRTISVSMKDRYAKAVELGNEGARELGYENLAQMWKSNYDMAPEAYEKMVDRVWADIEPFYEQLHCYVRNQLNKKYGSNVVSKQEAIPAHLLGNMWSQEWQGIMDLMDIEQKQSIDLTKILQAKKFDSRKMVSTAENFFVSLGMPKLPNSFWELSLFDQPRDRDVVCYASAWDMDLSPKTEDVRIKMCIKINSEDFSTIHHELGHDYYFLAYKNQPFLYQNSANDGFHEALGDTIALSMTPKYLQQIGLIPTAVSQKPETFLLPMALSKVAFLPFGIFVDKWRWKVLDGTIQPKDYNTSWWELKEKYQGVKPARPRPADAFDPGAKYHVPAFVPYSRYFLAHVLQFEFHRSLCQIAGHKGPLYTCSIYGNKEAGQRLWKMMEMGQSKPWTEALRELTGKTDMDATALREYFEPLETWLKGKNQGLKCGW